MDYGTSAIARWVCDLEPERSVRSELKDEGEVARANGQTRTPVIRPGNANLPLVP